MAGLGQRDMKWLREEEYQMGECVSKACLVVAAA